MKMFLKGVDENPDNVVHITAQAPFSTQDIFLLMVSAQYWSRDGDPDLTSDVPVAGYLENPQVTLFTTTHADGSVQAMRAETHYRHGNTLGDEGDDSTDTIFAELYVEGRATGGGSYVRPLQINQCIKHPDTAIMGRCHVTAEDKFDVVDSTSGTPFVSFSIVDESYGFVNLEQFAFGLDQPEAPLHVRRKTGLGAGNVFIAEFEDGNYNFVFEVNISGAGRNKFKSNQYDLEISSVGYIILGPGGGDPVWVYGDLKVHGNVGFYDTTPIAQPDVGGTRTGTLAQLQTVVANLLSALSASGLITNSTS